MKQIDWGKVAMHLDVAADSYAAAGDVAKERGDKEATIIFTLTGGLCSILACALWDGLEDDETMR